jgi:hypothetical protein
VPTTSWGERAVCNGRRTRRIIGGFDDRGQSGLCLFCPLSLGDVDDRGPAIGYVLPFDTLGRDAVQLDREGLPALRHEHHFGSDFPMLVGTLAHMVQESVLVLLRHRIGEWMPRERIAIRANQPGTSQVDLMNIAILVEGGIAHGGRVVKVYIAVAVLLQMPVLGL